MRLLNGSLVTTLGLTFLCLPFLNGCSGNGALTPGVAAAPALASGNWQISSNDPAAAHLSVLSGSLSGSAGALHGVLHPQGKASCAAQTTLVELSGSEDSSGIATFRGPLGGGVLTISGSLAKDGRSLTDATYTVTGGTCAFAKPANATAQAYMPISGNYQGTFADADGQVGQIYATLNQSPDANGDGNYTLTGTATLPNNPYFPNSVSISATQVSGGNFTFTYSDSGNSVTATGTFSSDAATLTVSNWTSSGNGGPDSGTGSMTRQ